MCDVHLIETARHHVFKWRGRCSFCDDLVDGEADVVVGHLDDGTPGALSLYYHPDCLEGIKFEGVDENDGCFSYGTPSKESQP